MISSSDCHKELEAARGSTPPTVTVVIPAYNAERFIERTLQSVLQQTFTDFELIVVNDGSTDATSEIIRRLFGTDARCRVIDRTNGGLSRARNLGLREARGEFVAFVDSDDLWHPEKLAYQVAALREGEGRRAGAVYAPFRVIDAEDRVWTKFDDRPAFSGYMLARHLYGRAVGNGSSLMVRRSVALEVGGFNPVCDQLGGCEDWDFEVKIARKYPIALVPYYLVGYRLYPGNMSSNGLKMCRAVIEVTSWNVEQNPHLPRWVGRKVMASAHEGALGILLEERRWGLLARRLPRLMRYDPLRGFAMMARVMNRVVRDILPEPRSTGFDPGTLPKFYDLTPDPRPMGAYQGRLFLNRRRRDLRILKKLERVDASLAARMETREPEFRPASSQPLSC